MTHPGSAKPPLIAENEQLATVLVGVLAWVSRGRSLDQPLPAEVQEGIARVSGLSPARLVELVAAQRGPLSVARASPEEARVFAAHLGAQAAALAGMARRARPSLEDFDQRFGRQAWLELVRLLLPSLTGRDDAQPYGVEALSELGVDPLLIGTLRQSVMAGRITRAPIAGRQALIGSSPSCEVVLSDPRVAPIHAELLRSDEGWRIVSLGDRATVVDGLTVASAPLAEGARVQIGPYRLRVRDDHVEIEPVVEPFGLVVRNLRRVVGDRVLLDDVSFAALSGEVIALVGPSGSGKTTLVNALSGAHPPDSGEILLGGQTLQPDSSQASGLVGEVPQDDIVLPELTVEESLRFAARLRLSPDGEPARHDEAVNRVLVELGVDDIRGSRIGDPERRGVSGGQRKRVNVGQEVISESTRVIFLDEPTSGLDPRAAGDIARTARRLADSGRIVVLVTHDLSASVLAQVDHLLVMVEGGRVAWFGPPADACRLFDVAIPVSIFEKLGQHRPAVQAATYSSSRAAWRWGEVRSRVLSSDLLGRHERLREPGTRPGTMRTLRTLIERYALVKRRDHGALLVFGLQPLLLAAVMGMVFPQPTSSLVFLLCLSALWFGMSGSVRELISDRVVWRRECRVGVGVGPWLGSKVLVLGLLVALQCLVMTLLVFVGCDLGHAGFELLALGPAVVLAGWSGLSTGLLMSALWSRSEAAVGTVVLLLVPQITFSGAMMPLSKLSAPAEALAALNPARYAFQLALRAGESMSYLNPLGEWKTRPISGELYTLGLRGPEPGGLGLDPAVLIGILFVQIVAQIGIAGVLLSRMRPRRRS